MIDSNIERRNFIIATAITGTTLSCFSSSITYGQNSKSSKFERVRLPNGNHLMVRQYGDQSGYPVLYFHGTPSSGVEASIIADDCSDLGINLIAVDRPGIGLSTPNCSRSLISWSKDIQALTNILQKSSGTKNKKFGLLGYSGGTSFALAVAQYLPEKIESTAIMAARTPGAPGVPWGVIDKELFQLVRHPRLAAIVIKRLRQKLLNGANMLEIPVYKRLAPIDQEFLRKNSNWASEAFLEATRCGVRGVINDSSMLVWPWCLDLSKIRKPVSIWQGTCDRLAPLATAEFLYEQLTQVKCQVHCLPDEGHITSFTEHAKDALAWIKKNKSQTTS
ncbi:MAG: hypothetical protein COA78_02985 [Blastopirellula sp.]|nr:MAG: hypothetical protein COA78_02985 [Blastopirellula sp.]